MKFYVAVLIAAVTVNCLVTTINAKAANDTLAVPYTDMLLPPFEDVATTDNGKDVKQEVKKINAITKATPVTTTTTTTKKPVTTTKKPITTTKKPITKEVKTSLPELSLEPFLPPLFEAKIEEKETKTTKTTTPKPKTTTTPITTTIKTTTTSKPLTTTTTTKKPSKVEVPELLLEPLLPPLLDNTIDNVKDDKIATTQKPSIPVKTTKKSYYPQPTKDLHVNDQKHHQQQQQLKHLQNAAAATKEVKNYNKPSATSSSSSSSSIKHVAESRIQTKQVSLATKHYMEKLQSKIETMTHQHVAKQVAQQRHNGGNTKYQDKQFNYSFDFYLGSTTPRPPKSGLPTITPFPHRLGR